MAELKYPNTMKSYISRKFPLATRMTECSFSFRCGGVSIRVQSLAPCGARAEGSLEFRLDAGIIRPAHDIVCRRIGTHRRTLHHGRTLVEEIGQPGGKIDLLQKVPVRLQGEVAVGRYRRFAQSRQVNHGPDISPVKCRRDRSDGIAKRRVRLPLRVSQIRNGRAVRGSDRTGIAEAAGEVHTRDSGNSGYRQRVQVGDVGLDLELA